MAEHKVVIVSELAPRLKEFSSVAARKFLREYVAYENRLDATEAQTPLRRCLEPDDLETLLQCSTNMRCEVVREAPAATAGPTATASARGAASSSTSAPAPVTTRETRAQASRTARSAVLTPMRSLGRLRETSDDESGEEHQREDEEDLDVPDRVVWMSNAHIEMMIVHVLGPEDQTETSRILRDIKMAKESPFLRLGQATNYVRDWKDALRWCKNYLPRQKAMIKFFLGNVMPRKLAYSLEDLGIKTMERLMVTFVDEYQKCVKAKKVLTCMETTNEVAPKSGGWKAEPRVAVNASNAERKLDKPKSEMKGAGAGGDDWKLKAKCFKCQKTGHISPDCPENNMRGDERGRFKKMGAMLQMPKRPTGPYLAVDLAGPECSEEDRKMRLMCNMDSGAECNIVGEKWVTHLEQHGGVIWDLQTPITIEWLDSTTRLQIKKSIDLRVTIAECKAEFLATFLIVPWDIDYMVVGWETLKAEGLLKTLEDFLQVQKNMNVSIGLVHEEVNMKIENMDGVGITSDSLRWPADDESDDIPEKGLESEEEEPIMSAAQEQEITELVAEFEDVFNELPAGSALVEPMTITAKPGWKRPPMEPFRRYSPKVEEAIRFDLKKQLDAGVVEKSEAKNGCHVHAVPKPDSESGYRFCVDYRLVNSGVETEAYPLPPISTILLSLSVAVFFARLDLKSGYWQFPVAENCQDWLAFFALGQMYTYRVVPMGFVQSSFHVQRAMYSLFSEYFARGIFVYLDDIIIYAASWEEFIHLCRAALTILRAARLCCKRSKCSFGLPSVHILGHVVSRHGLRMDDRRKEAVLSIPFPRTTRELRRFLGMCNYMRMFIPAYAVLAKPLSALVNTAVAEWPVKDMQGAFNRVKDAVAEQLSLAHLDYSVPLVLQTDASTLGVGTALINRRVESDRVVACCSHAFTEAEMRWKTVEQECFAVVFGAIYFYAILCGHHFVIETDHRNLMYIHSGTSAKVVRWSLLLQSLDYSISFIPGVSNVVADTLSRAPARIGHALHAIRLSDFVASPVTRRLGAVRAVDEPVSEEQARTIFLAFHNDTVGHRGLHATLRALQDHGHTWARMSRDVARWIAECPICQKYRLGGKAVISVPSPIATFQIFEQIGIDFVGPLPKDMLDNCYICNVVCMTTNYCELFAVEAATAITAAHSLLNVVARYGCFQSLRSDRGSHFVNAVIEEFCRLFEIQQVLTLPERPQANAVVERNGGEVMRHLRALVAARDLRSIWSVILPLTQRIVNNTWRGRIGATPHRLIHWAPTDLDRGLFEPFQSEAVVPPLETSYVLQLQQAYERLLDETALFVITEQEQLQQQYADVVPTEFAVGGYVLMSYLVRPPSKLAARWAGPYRILAKKGNNVTLEDLTGGSQKQVDVSRLKHFIVAPGIDVQAVAAADMGEAQVDAVLAHRGTVRNRASLEFQVQWSDGDNTWETWEQVRKLQAVDDYIKSHPRAGLKSLLK